MFAHKFIVITASAVVLAMLTKPSNTKLKSYLRNKYQVEDEAMIIGHWVGSIFSQGATIFITDYILFKTAKCYLDDKCVKVWGLFNRWIGNA